MKNNRLKVSNFFFEYLFILALACPWGEAIAAWHDEGMASVPDWLKPRLDLRVHYVRLKGRKGDLALAVHEKNLAESMQQQCVPNQTFPERILNRDERFVDRFPEFASYFDIEIYYAANRTLTVTQRTDYGHDLRTCAVIESKSTTLKFSSAAGICDVNMKAKTARRNCDMQEHISAPLPLVLRGLVHRAEPKRPLITREFASTQCIQYHLALLPPYGDFEVCVAQPPRNGPGPNPVAPEGTHFAVPGVLLQAKGAIDMQADEVRWNLLVSSSLFSLPPGFDVRSLPSVPR
jgi:hypothetical protein